jgi:hypothetical protein
LQKFFLFFVLFLTLLIIGCPHSDSNNSSAESNSSSTGSVATPGFSSWNGDFSIKYAANDLTGTGTITNLKLNPDNTITGTWTSFDFITKNSTDKISVSITGSYLITGQNITFTCSGTAVNSSNVQTSCNLNTDDGIIDSSSNAHGTFKLNWGTAITQGSWNLTKIN